jgi:hypothetical protein
MKIKDVDCLCRPDTRSPVNPCYSRVYDQLIDGKFELTGAWTGWKIRGDGKLTGPGGVKFSPVHLTVLWKLRRDLLDAMITDAFTGPTVLNQLANRWNPVTEAANDDGSDFAGNGHQTAFAGF